MRKYNIAVVGATGVVGREVVKILAERNFPVGRINLFASPRSVNRYLTFDGKRIEVNKLTSRSFNGVDIAFFAVEAALSHKWVPQAVKSGAVVIDKSSAFRMRRDVPLVVPEVNTPSLAKHKGIIANPNCSTIQLVVALKPLHDYARIKRVVVTTFQAVSGAGMKAISEMEQETIMSLKSHLAPRPSRVFPHPIAFNVIPQIPQAQAFDHEGDTGEENKIINETKKILDDPSIKITATCVRVPVYIGHSESVNIETRLPLSPARARQILKKAKGLKVWDDPSRECYPTPREVAGRDEVFVGRIRRDPTIKNGLNFWVVSDNLRKGAALNAVQIAESLIHD